MQNSTLSTHTHTHTHTHTTEYSSLGESGFFPTDHTIQLLPKFSSDDSKTKIGRVQGRIMTGNSHVY
jgi:hypothetical protein